MNPAWDNNNGEMDTPVKKIAKPKWKKYTMFRPWIWYLCPAALLVWIMKRNFHSCRMYEDKDVIIEMWRHYE